MKAIAMDRFGGADVLAPRELKTPEPGPSEILVQVRAAGVNPVDWKIREGYLDGRMPHAFPLIPGWDVAGVVKATGPGVTSFSVGDEIWSYCRKESVQWGSYAEYMVLPEHLAAHKPSRYSFSEAAAVPLAALTAWQALHEAGGMCSGQTVLILNASGGVGGFAVQLAKLSGARIIGTASSRNRDYLTELGVDIFVDYTENRVVDAVRKEAPEGVDIIFDCIGGETTEASVGALHKGGTLVTIANFGAVPPLQERGIKAIDVFVRPDRHQLDELSELAAQDKLRVDIQAEYPLAEAAKALQISQDGHVRGKLVLVP